MLRFPPPLYSVLGSPKMREGCPDPQAKTHSHHPPPPPPPPWMINCIILYYSHISNTKCLCHIGTPQKTFDQTRSYSTKGLDVSKLTTLCRGQSLVSDIVSFCRVDTWTVDNDVAPATDLVHSKHRHQGVTLYKNDIPETCEVGKFLLCVDSVHTVLHVKTLNGSR